MNESFANEQAYDLDRLERHLWARQRAGWSRRAVLRQLSRAMFAAAALTGLPDSIFGQTSSPIVKPAPADKFRALGTNYETLFEAFKGQGYLTPASLFFVRNHTSTPRIDSAAWRLRIEGSGVARPRSFTLDELKAMDSVTLTRAIECAGNGRSFFQTQQGTLATGTQWQRGAIGVGQWTGVKLSTLLQEAGVKPTAVDIQPEGLDAEVGATGHVRRPLPISRALDNDVLVVYGMNGQPLPPDHGFPARLLVPGWIGIANIKWLGRIEVSETPLFSAWNTAQYRLFGDLYPTPIVLSTQVVKSAFELPLPGALPPGRHTLTGRSWSAHGSIARVEVSFNDGASWTAAKLKRGGNDYQAWAQWEIPWTAQPGSHVLKARATDSRGNSQPDATPFNTQGYLFGAVMRHPVMVAG